MPGPSSWDDARVARLKRLWLDGASAAEIARALAGGLTRNAVIGKLHRLGLARQARGAPAAPAGPKRRVRAARPGAAARARAEAVPATDPAPARGGETVASIGRHGCRWPYGDPLGDGFRFCGRPAVRGAYCAAHAAVAYRSPPPRDHLLKLAGC